MTAACHCLQCQKQTGTECSVIVGVPTDSVTVRGDTLKTYEHSGTSGLPVLRKFCGNCGSPVLTFVKAYEGLLFLKAGTLNDPAQVKPELEIWCDSKIGWSTIDGETNQVPGNPAA
ncbi:MAG: GFA family protein [Granulosicoccus sp.]